MANRRKRADARRHGGLIYIYVSGDIPHRGHKRALEQAKALGLYLIVGVITDNGIAEYKRSPVMHLDERMELIGAWEGIVDEVVIQQHLDPVPNLKKYKPNIVVHGDDWGENFPGAEYMRRIGGQAIRTKYYPHQSTTKIIEEIVRRYKEGTLP